MSSSWGKRLKENVMKKKTYNHINKEHNPLERDRCFLNILFCRAKIGRMRYICFLKPLVNSLHSNLLPSHSVKIKLRDHYWNFPWRSWELSIPQQCQALLPSTYCSQEVTDLLWELGRRNWPCPALYLAFREQPVLCCLLIGHSVCLQPARAGGNYNSSEEMVRSPLGNRSPLVYSSALPVKRQMVVFIEVSPKEDRLSTATTAKKYKHILFLYRQNGAIWCNCSHYRWARTWPTAPYPLLRKDIPLAEGHMLVHTLYPCLCLPGSTSNIASA